MSQPSLTEFLKGCDPTLTDDQIALAESLIEYIKRIVMLGRRGGRTFAIRAVNKYFEDKYACEVRDIAIQERGV